MRYPNGHIYETCHQGMGEELGVKGAGMGLLFGEMKKNFF